MRFSLSLLLMSLVFTPAGTGTASTLDRPLDPVVVTGEALCPDLIGLPPGQIVAFRFTGGGWEPIPVQVDEVAVLDIVTPYGPYAALGGHPPPTGVSERFYTDPGTYTGADPDPTLDTNDEIVFMAGDAGEEAEPFTHPSGVIPGSGCRVTVTDPLDGGTGVVYLFRQDGSLDPGAGQRYVDYRFELLAGTYPEDYGIVSGFNPEETTVTTDRYRHHFSDRWIDDGLEIFAGSATGTDILDRHQNFFAPGVCGRTEDSFSQGEGCFVTNRSGPVRAIRSYMGANSGPLTQRTHIFYEGRHDIFTDLRVHEIPSVYDVFDYEPAATGMVYESNLNPAGLLIDGEPEAAVTGRIEWELVTGAHGSLVIVHDQETDMVLGTEGSIDSYWEDDATRPESDCTGDRLAHGTSGSVLFFAPGEGICTDPLNPGCQNLRLVRAKRHLYYEPPGLAAADAVAHDSDVRTPLAVSAEPVGAVPWTLALDPVHAGGELRLTFTLGSPEPALWVNYAILTSPALQSFPLWGVPLPAVTPPVEYTVTFPFPSVGRVGIYTALYVAGEAEASALALVETGPRADD